MSRKRVIAAAWPYANGSLHLGHVAALLGADILARYFRLCGDDVLFVSGSDCHGTPIVFEADRRGINPSEIADKFHEEFVDVLIKGLGFSYDIYTKTTTQNHHKVVQEVFLKLHKEGKIYTKTEELPYCPHCQRFLPDRYIEGECPTCHFLSARGDQCDECGNLIDPRELIDSKCKLCNGAPEWRESEHFFLKLSAFQEQLKKWVEKSQEWRLNAVAFTKNLLEQGLHDRAITRDISWGVPIPLPGYEDGKKSIYVWFEAVLGYLSASKEVSQLRGDDDLWRSFWENKEAVHYYVHGKDNIPFHTIVLPAILLGYGGLNLPDRIVSSEYLTLEGKQFSKSRHWAVWLPDFLAEFDSETLRYYLVANGAEGADADFSWQKFRIKTNSELIGNFGNFIHRILSFIKINFSEGVSFPDELDGESVEFLELAKKTFSLTGESIEAGRFRESLRHILKLVEHGNRYVNDTAPWTTIKTDRAKTERTLAVAGHVIRSLAILVSPFLPRTAEKIARDIDFDVQKTAWCYPSPETFIVKDIKPLYKKIEEVDTERQIAKLS